MLTYYHHLLGKVAFTLNDISAYACYCLSIDMNRRAAATAL